MPTLPPAVTLPPAPTAPPGLPTSPPPEQPRQAASVSQAAHSLFIPLVRQAPQGLYVDIHDRQAVLNFYNQDYLAYSGAAINWTGSQNPCNPGTTGAVFKDEVIHRVNYFRAMAGLPADVTLLADMSSKAQAAALIMSANGNLSHTPPTSWLCYSSDGAAGAGSANIALGMYAWGAISGYMRDPGSGNSAAGHRRWILYPQTKNMGSGDIPPSSYRASNALVVFDSHSRDPRPAVRDGFVVWPPAGYVPSTIVYARWSFSYPGADFSAATVAMTSNGSPVSLTPSPVTNGYGENTLVWIPLGMADNADWPRPAVDTSYNVTVSNVKISGVPRSFSYTVTIFGP